MKGFFLVGLLFLSACSTLEKPFLYEVKKTSNTMYLFGTIHLGVPFGDIPNVVMDRFDQSERFDMEIDFENYDTKKQLSADIEKRYAEVDAILNSLHKSNPEAATRLGKILHADYLKNNKPLETPEKKLSQRLTPRAWAYTRAYLKQMDLETLEKISPKTIAHFVLETKSISIEASPAWFRRLDPKFSMDLVFLSRAREQGKTVYQLDDAEVLAPDCDDLVSSEQINGAFETKDSKSLLGDFDKLEKAYRAGNEADVQKMTAVENPDLMTCLLDDRNKKWIPRLIDDSEAVAMRGYPPLFVAVGTAHLFGPSGLIELLKKEGYSVERIGN